MSNSMSVSMHIGSGKNAINNLEKIKRCDLHNNRKYKNNRNEEIDLTLSKYNVTIAGSKNITEDIKEFYKKEFSEAVYNYNKNQKDERRKIVDYLEKMDKDSKSNIATEFIFQIGDKEDWENKSLEDKKKTVEIFKKVLPILEAKGIKTINASLHLDETSPHLHLIAVPIIENQKRGLSKQVSQNKVITKIVLNDIRTEVEKAFITEYNKIYGTNKELKKGSEIEEHLQVNDYKDLKKVLEVAKKTADKQVLKEKIEQDYKKISSEVKEKEKENNFLTNQITKLVEEKENKKQDLEKIREDIKNIDSLKVDIKQQNEEIEIYKNNAVETREKIDNLKKEFNRLEDEKTEEVKKIEEVKKQIEEQNRIRIAQNNILRELEETEKIKEERKKKLKELEEQNQELLEKIKNAESNINSNTNQLTELEEKEKEILKEVTETEVNVNQKDKILEVNKMFKYIRNADEYDIYTHFKDFEMFQFLSGGEFKETFIYFLENIKEKNTININVNDEMLKEIKKMNTKYNATLDEEDKKEIVEQLNKVDNKTTNNDEELEKNEDDFELNL